MLVQQERDGKPVEAGIRAVREDPSELHKASEDERLVGRERPNTLGEERGDGGEDAQSACRVVRLPKRGEDRTREGVYVRVRVAALRARVVKRAPREATRQSVHLSVYFNEARLRVTGRCRVRDRAAHAGRDR